MYIDLGVVLLFFFLLLCIWQNFYAFGIVFLMWIWEREFLNELGAQTNERKRERARSWRKQMSEDSLICK